MLADYPLKYKIDNFIQYDSLITVKAAHYECVIKTDQP